MQKCNSGCEIFTSCCLISLVTDSPDNVLPSRFPPQPRMQSGIVHYISIMTLICCDVEQFSQPSLTLESFDNAGFFSLSLFYSFDRRFSIWSFSSVSSSV